MERTFGWLGRYRSLSRDFEPTVSSSESVVYIASIRRMLKLATNWLKKHSLNCIGGFCVWKEINMLTAYRKKVTVRPDGSIEILDSLLKPGTEAEVILD